MTSPASGWYPDPSGQPGERWWNGTAWTQETRAGVAPPPPPAPPATGSPAPAAWDGFGNPVTRPSYDDRATYGAQAPVGTTPPPYAGGPSAAGGPPYAGGPGGYPGAPGGAPGTGAKPSFLARNGYSFGTVGVAIAYLLLLVYAHVAIVGILPFFLGVGAVRRKEPLGWPALVIGVLAFIVGIYEFAH